VKSGDRRLERSESGVRKAGTSKVVASAVLVMDQCVSPREQVLNVPIACRRYESGKPSSWLSTETCLFPTASLAAMGEKVGMDPRIGQPSCCRLFREHLFSGAVDLFKSVDDYTKGCYALTT
jgi:hypothetical protein